MKPQAKRLVIKTTLLAVLVNTALLLLKHKQLGRLSPHDYAIAAESFATTIVLIILLAFALSKFGRFGKDQRR